MAMKEKERDISFVIEKHLGVISKSQSGWTKELNLVAWNGARAKVDLRDWDPDHAHMSKGITLRRDEAEQLARLLWGFLGEEERKAAAVAAAKNGEDAPPAAEPLRVNPETGEVLVLNAGDANAGDTGAGGANAGDTGAGNADAGNVDAGNVDAGGGGESGDGDSCQTAGDGDGSWEETEPLDASMPF